MTVTFLNEIRVQLIQYHFDCHDGRNWNLLKKAIRAGAMNYKNTAVTNYTNLVVLALQHNKEIVSMNPKQFQEAEDVLDTSSSNSEVQSTDDMAVSPPAHESSDSKDDGTALGADFSTEDMAVSPPAHESSDSKDDGTALGADFSTEEQSLLADAGDNFLASDVDYCYEGDDDDYQYDHNQPLSKRDYHHTWQELSTRPYVRSPFTINAGKSSSDRRITELESVLADLKTEVDLLQSYVKIDDVIDQDHIEIFPLCWIHKDKTVWVPWSDDYPFVYRCGASYLCIACYTYKDALCPSTPVSLTTTIIDRHPTQTVRRHLNNYAHPACMNAYERKWSVDRARYLAMVEKGLLRIFNNMIVNQTSDLERTNFKIEVALDHILLESLPFLKEKVSIDTGEIICACDTRCQTPLHLGGGPCSISPDQTRPPNKDAYCHPKPWDRHTEQQPPITLIAAMHNTAGLHLDSVSREDWEEGDKMPYDAWINNRARKMVERTDERLLRHEKNKDPGFISLAENDEDLHEEVKRWERLSNADKKRDMENVLHHYGVPDRCPFEICPGKVCGVPLVWGVTGVSNLASMDILNPPQLFYKIGGECRWVCLKHQLPHQALRDTSTCVLTEEMVDDMIFILRDLWKKEKRFLCSDSNFLTNDSSHRHAKTTATKNKKKRESKQVREEDDEDFEEDL
jgi:hypothetical protein